MSAVCRLSSCHCCQLNTHSISGSRRLPAAAGKLWEEVQALHKHCTTTQKGRKDCVLACHPTERPLPFQPIQFFIQGLVMWHRLALFLQQSCLILLNAQITGAPIVPVRGLNFPRYSLFNKNAWGDWSCLFAGCFP